MKSGTVGGGDPPVYPPSALHCHPFTVFLRIISLGNIAKREWDPSTALSLSPFKT